MNAAPDTAAATAGTQTEFARAQGWSKGYVSKLASQGRLAYTAQGLVDFAASLGRIKATSGAAERAAAPVQGPAYADSQDRERFYSAELKRLELERQTGRLRAADDEALSLRRDLVQAKDDVAAGRAGFGEHHSTIALHAASLEALDGQVAEVIAALADLGIVAVREDIALEPAFWAQFPGNFRYIARKGLVSTANFAGLASLHNFPVGKARRAEIGLLAIVPDEGRGAREAHGLTDVEQGHGAADRERRAGDAGPQGIQGPAGLPGPQGQAGNDGAPGARTHPPLKTSVWRPPPC